MTHNVLIRYQPPIACDIQVGLAGDFTDWQIIPLNNESGIFQKRFFLPKGFYQYKFIVDGVWIADPEVNQTLPDSYGGYNSVLIVNGESSADTINEFIYAEDIVLRNEPKLSVPEWVAEGVVYQIFPDRFCNGNPQLNPDFSEWYYHDCKLPPEYGKYLLPNQEYFHFVDDWYDYSSLKQSLYLPKGKPDWWSFYGGDIEGVRQKLDYLLDLGINIIYFNPLWQAKSNHKYDAADFKKIDPHFADEDSFKDFVSVCHSKGIRIVLDIALNHTGETFWAFRDCVDKGEQSQYWNWYDWQKWPLPHPLPDDFNPKEYYQCWWGVKDMPDLNYDLSRHHPDENAITDFKDAVPNQPLIDHILESISWWLMEMDVDGFRLDVPDEVPFWFWQIFRQKVKSLKPDTWLVGELWNNAPKWVSPLYFDSVMNYAHFKEPVLDFFVKQSIDKSTFLQQLYLGLKSYPKNAALAMMNLLGSHDTWRIGELTSECLDSLYLAIIFQMTYVGTPHIYYGDEIAMQGAKDPDNRRPFNWKWADDVKAVNLRCFYQRLIELRRSYRVLQKGDIRFIKHPDLLIFQRYDKNSSLTIVINNTEESTVYQLNSAAKIIYSHNLTDNFALDNVDMMPMSALIVVQSV